MTQNISLEELVLGYSRQLDGLVEPPAYGAYEVLLPDDVAARWGLSAHQRFAFLPEIEKAAYIHFGHNLVETIVDELRVKVANGRFFINNVRPEKPHLYEVIEKAFSLPNARMFAVQGMLEKVSLHAYVRFNFKVSLIADEKRELILPILMDLQTGYSRKLDEIERVALFDLENQFPELPTAALLWSQDLPLSSAALAGLLELARASVPFELGDTLDSLQRRLQRFLELDRARLNDYYDDLEKDSRRRLQRAEEDRRPALEAKLKAISTERSSKLVDVEQKYHLHIQLELVNLAVIAQPKLDLTVEIRKRGLSLKRSVTWDPLLHTVEGLACDVCARPGHSLWLCDNGHLVHADCLAPQCVDCKRVFCQKCSHEMQTCAVCSSPVCIHSLNHCRECGKATCQKHVGLCHATEPDLVLSPATSNQKPSLQADVKEQAKKPAVETRKSPKKKPPVKREIPVSLKSFGKPIPQVTGEFMEVYSDPAQNQIIAYIIAKKRQIATRQWSMSEAGIDVNCWCEKKNCSERGIVYRPMNAESINEQVNGFIEQFADEYAVQAKKIRFFHTRNGQPVGETKLKVPANWKDPLILERAWAGFDELRLKNRNRQ